MSRKLMVVFAVCVLIVGGALTVQAANTSYNMHFTGYSDGVYFFVDTTWGIVTGHYTGADNKPLVGMRCALVKEGGVQAIVWRDVYESVHVIRANGTWTYYNMSGGVANSGTWHWGTPLQAEAAAGSGLKKSND
jgi:hypothetical protein